MSVIARAKATVEVEVWLRLEPRDSIKTSQELATEMARDVISKAFADCTHERLHASSVGDATLTSLTIGLEGE